VFWLSYSGYQYWGKKMGKFVVKKDRKKQYRFRLIADNGKVIAVSEGYKTKTGCLRGIRSVKSNADSCIVEE